MKIDIPLWMFLASYIIHLLDETMINGGFIKWMKKTFWPGYTANMNFWFNSGAILLIFISNLLYDLFGGSWIIVALIWPFGFALHGVTLHLFWTLKQRKLNPGLATSVIYWIMAYFFVKYGYVAGQISYSDFWIGLVLGIIFVGGFLTFVPTLIIPKILLWKSRPIRKHKRAKR